jgi:MFS family permease
VKRDLQILTVGFSIRTLGAALYSPFLALFLYAILHVGYLEIGVIFVGLGAIQLPFGFVGGFWTDRVGRRRLIVLSLFTEAIVSASLAYAFDVRSLALAIAVAATGGALLASTQAAFSAYIADFTKESERTLGFTWYRIGFNGGYASGVALGGSLIAVVGFVGAVGIAAAIIGVAGVFALLALAPSPYDLELARRGTSAALPTSTDLAPKSKRTVRESFSLLLRDRTALLVATGMMLMYVTASQWNVTYALFVHNKMGISYAILGLGLALNGLVVVFGQSFTTHRVLGMRHTTIFILGGLLYGVAFLLLGLSALLVLLPVVLFFVATVVLTVGENLGSIPSSTLPSNLAPPGEVGAYNGAFFAFFSAASIAGIFLGGAVLATVVNPLWEWVLLCVPLVPGFVILRLVAPRLSVAADRA